MYSNEIKSSIFPQTMDIRIRPNFDLLTSFPIEFLKNFAVLCRKDVEISEKTIKVLHLDVLQSYA